MLITVQPPTEKPNRKELYWPMYSFITLQKSFYFEIFQFY